MTNKKRVFLIVLDSVGAGSAPDAPLFGDEGANTLKSVYESGKLNIPTMSRLGIGSIDGLSFLGINAAHEGRVARMTERSAGKDTTIGHWEIAGYISENPLPTYPDGFDEDIIDKLTKAWGRGVLCNRPYSGTAVINDYGAEHLREGKLIVYTSADSVLQIAAHTDAVSLDELYGYCLTARELMTGKNGVGRVIARPFCGVEGSFVRTADRRDFSIEPPCRMITDALKENGMDSIAVGKISDIFACRGFTRSIHTHSNDEGMSACDRLLDEDFRGLCFVNLVDFDMLWGHRRDVLGYAEGLNRFDAWLDGFISRMRDGDMLIITADHGCDPAFVKTTDHTREYTPCIIYGSGVAPENLGTRSTFADIAATVSAALGVPFECAGESMI